MKKHIKFVIFLLVVFGLLLNSAFIKRQFFERLDLSDKNTKKEKTKTDKYYFDDKNNNSYKGNIYDISGSKNLDLKLKKYGKFKIFFDIVNISSGSLKELNFKLFHKSNKGRELLSSSVKIKTTASIFEDIKFAKGDKLIVEFTGTGKVLITNPAIYKNLIDDLYVFLISVDTLRADFLEIYGNKDKISDNITEFSKDAVIFENCYSTSSWTLPAHISLFTGMDVFNHYVYNQNMKLPDMIPFYPEELYKHSLMYSFNAGVFLDPKYGYFRGFDYYNSLAWLGKKRNRKQSVHESEIMFKNTQTLLESSTSSSTFFFLHTYQVHSPYSSHKGLKFSDKILAQKSPRWIKIPQHLGEKNLKGRRAKYRKLPDKKAKNIVNLYKAEIEYFDHQFGKFIKYLKSKGIYDRSLIVVFSDHGDEFFDHKGWGHGHTLYEELIKIPLLIKFPFSENRGKKIIPNTSIVDIFPTLFDYLQIKNSYKTDGQSLMNLIKGEKSENGRFIISVLKYDKTQREGIDKFAQKLSIIWKNHKLIYNFKYTKKLKEYYATYPPPEYTDYELYDLKLDKHEKNNIVGKKENKKIFIFLKNRMNRIKRDIFNKKNRSETLKISDKNKEKLKTLGYL